MISCGRRGDVAGDRVARPKVARPVLAQVVAELMAGGHERRLGLDAA